MCCAFTLKIIPHDRKTAVQATPPVKSPQSRDSTHQPHSLFFFIPSKISNRHERQGIFSKQIDNQCRRLGQKTHSNPDHLNIPDKVSHPSGKKDRNAAKRNTVLHPVTLNVILSLSKCTEYSKARLAL